MAEATEYARQVLYNSGKTYEHFYNIDGRCCGNYTTWWLRSPGKERTQARFMHGGGAYISVRGIDVEAVYGIRPAIYIKREK